MSDVMQFDDLNRLSYARMFQEGETRIRLAWYQNIGTAGLVKAVEDTLYDVLLYAYSLGITDTDSDLKERRALSDAKAASSFKKSADYKIGGKTILDRIQDHVDENSLPRMLTLADTEMHRMYGIGSLDEAEAVQRKTGTKVFKTWHTMEDEKVRDTHAWIDQQKISLDEVFWTYDDAAKAPGGFSKVENNANCRCWLTYSFD